jgi:starch synthase
MQGEPVSARVLFAAGEALPFSKTGGLADVAYALPRALVRAGLDARVLTIAYRGALDRLRDARPLTELDVRGQRMRVWEGTVDDSGLRAWLLDHPPLYGRAGSPYVDEHGHEHGDNAWRFGCFSEAIAKLALGVNGVGWRPQLVHLNDWHTGLAALWLGRSAPRPATVFTIHNLAYQGVFARHEFDALGLPPEEWHPEAVEFYGGFSFMKAGLLRSDAITTVSPTYAQEIQTPTFGERLDGVLRVRAGMLRGIVNGIDAQTWNPAADPLLFQTYDAGTVDSGKRANKRGLQAQLGLEVSDARPLFGFIGRLAPQKGADLLLEVREAFARGGAQLALLGAGDRGLEEAFRAWASTAPDSVAVHVGYDETLAHRIEAGADFFMMPSRYEPCGLNQMYSQRYGTVPIVHRTGGLRDTVSDLTGILFDHADAGGVRYALSRAFELFAEPARLRAMSARGMARDFDWSVAARQYVELYEGLARPRA